MPKLYRLADLYHRWRTKSRRRTGKPSGLLLLSCGGLGDTILFSHAIDAFTDYATQDEKITVLLRKDGAKTGFLFPKHIDTLIVDFKRFRKDLRYRLKILNQLFEANFRSVITTDYLRHPDLDEAMAFAAQGVETIAMNVRPWQKYQKQLDRNAQKYSRLFESGPTRQDKVLRWFRFANWLTGQDRQPSLKRMDVGDVAASTPPLVLIQAFSAVKAKQSAPAVYASLIDALPDQVQIRFTGAPGEMEANPAFKPLLERPNVAYEDAGFEELVPMLQKARLVVSVDTAVMHLSAAVGAPTLCLASAAYVGEIVPYANEHTPISVDFYYKSMDCEGCLGSCIKPLKDGAYLCIAELQTQQIIARAIKLFENSAR